VGGEVHTNEGARQQSTKKKKKRKESIKKIIIKRKNIRSKVHRQFKSIVPKGAPHEPSPSSAKAAAAGAGAYRESVRMRGSCDLGVPDQNLLKLRALNPSPMYTCRVIGVEELRVQPLGAVCNVSLS
jgi:hypothetical protein